MPILTPKTRLVLKYTLLGGAAMSLLSACKTAPGYSPAEEQMAQNMTPAQYQMRTQEEREAIETQDLFTQAAFWSREYDLNPADLEAAIKLSSVLRRMGNPSQALEVVTTSRAMYPRDVTLIAELGANLIAMERGKDAIAPLSQALRSAPGNARLWSLTGAAHDQIGQFAQARDYYNRALSLAPHDPNIVGNVGLSFALEGDPATAEVWLRRAAAMPGASAHVRQNLSLVLGLQGKYAEAEALARQDLSPEAAEANMGYMKSLRGSSRSYSALGQAPVSAPSAPPASPPAGSYATQAQQYAPQYTAPQAQPSPVQSYGRYTPPAAAPQSAAALPQGRPNVTITGQEASGSSREALLAAQRARQGGVAPGAPAVQAPQRQAPQQMTYGGYPAGSAAPIPQPSSAKGQPPILDRIAQSVQPGSPPPKQGPVQMRQYPAAPNPYAQHGYPSQSPYPQGQAPAPQQSYPGYPQNRAPARRRG